MYFVEWLVVVDLQVDFAYLSDLNYILSFYIAAYESFSTSGKELIQRLCCYK